MRGEAISRKGMDAAKELEIKPEDFENAVGQFILVGETKKTVIGFR